MVRWANEEQVYQLIKNSQEGRGKIRDFHTTHKRNAERVGELWFREKTILLKLAQARDFIAGAQKQLYQIIPILVEITNCQDEQVI
ncbi:hypothetical protein [Nostoc sp. ChiVER01]|uniref:hypothetical protein n=1 Tax=Nostoc sp. ChiVER01 TaxID=3075382 RepID=UPI002AD2A35D|nr:hypothetical protein [Nostoc sp. ChiVER01]MDZ8225521.1 hypothetical protein [Nostoc sp. ChiVER01]